MPDARSGLPESPLDPADVVLIPGAAEALRRLHDAGFGLVGVSNQPAAAKGIVTLERLQEVQARVLELLAAQGVVPDGFRICHHHPEGTAPELSGPCNCRKPAPGMLLDAAAELGLDLSASWMIGDSDADVAAGRAAGCRTVLVEHPGSAHKRHGGSGEDACAADLLSAARLVVAANMR